MFMLPRVWFSVCKLSLNCTSGMDCLWFCMPNHTLGTVLLWFMFDGGGVVLSGTPPPWMVTHGLDWPTGNWLSTYMFKNWLTCWHCFTLSQNCLKTSRHSSSLNFDSSSQKWTANFLLSSSISSKPSFSFSVSFSAFYNIWWRRCIKLIL